MPTLLCVPITVQDEDQAAADARIARQSGADLVEFRIDELFAGDLEAPAGGPHPAVLAIERLVAACPLPCIVTCRSSAEGGAYDGDDDARVSLYERLGTKEPGKSPTYLDVELAAYARSANLKQKINLAVRHPGQQREVGPSLILSMHDFTGRPADLTRRVLAMQNEPACAVAKFAIKARSLRDNLELFELLEGRTKPMIALAMGEFGLLSRVLAPKFGGFLTFASLRPAAATAPGQPTVADLTGLYRFRSIGRRTKVYGIIGWPVTQSKSPMLHNAAFDEMGHDGVYLPLPIPTPEGGTAEDAYLIFKATLLDLVHDPRLEFSGASVTIPHKEHLVRLAREQGWAVDEVAAGVGAANTLVIERDASGRAVSIRVMNTDVAGIVDPLRREIGSLAGVRAAVVGAGGAGRAAAYGLARAGANVTFFNRDPHRARAVADELARNGTGGVETQPLDALAAFAGAVLVNCTPVGMKGGPDPNACPMPIDELAARGNFGPGSIVFDTVYNPVRTPLLARSGEKGARTIDGVRMFVRQAAVQSHAWTGRWPDEARFDRLVRESLAEP